MTLATVAFATSAACATDSSTSGSGASSAEVGTTTPTPVDVGDTTPPAPDVEAIVSATGGGGLIDAVEVTGLQALGPPAAGQPWLRFDLVLHYCCGEPNSVIFASGPQGFDTSVGEPPTLQLRGPACGGPLVCTDGSRTVELMAPGRLPCPLS